MLWFVLLFCLLMLCLAPRGHQNKNQDADRKCEGEAGDNVLQSPKLESRVFYTVLRPVRQLQKHFFTLITKVWLLNFFYKPVSQKLKKTLDTNQSPSVLIFSLVESESRFTFILIMKQTLDSSHSAEQGCKNIILFTLMTNCFIECSMSIKKAQLMPSNQKAPL